MKFCENCGTKIEKDSIYCSKCGKKGQTEETKKTKQVESPTAKKEGLGNASMIIGIISLVLSFVVNVFIFPLALVGLILGIVNKAQNGKKISGIILNGVAMLIAVIVLLLWIFLFGILIGDDFSEKYTEYSEIVPNEIEEENLLGRWNCKNGEKVLSSDYELILTLDNDKKFTMTEYNNEKNYIKGIYSFEEDDNHTIVLNPLEKYEHGDLVNKWDDTNVTYIIKVRASKNRFRAILADNENGKVYYCKK